MAIVLFFIGHWWISVFFQSFFLHRYGAHKQFTMSKGWERFFHLCTWLTQGSSFLSPRGYAILHRMHHAYSDTEKDPHSPHNSRTILGMKLDTLAVYTPLAKPKGLGDPPAAEKRFLGDYPVWPTLDRVADTWITRLAFGAVYTVFYLHFATHTWMYALIPLHYVMGPIHGAIVNWCGHKYGYRNFDSTDKSRNTLIFDFLTAGELFQNNHHKFAMSANFAARWFEIDPTYQVMRLFHWLKIIDMSKSQKMRYPAEPLEIALEPAE